MGALAKVLIGTFVSGAALAAAAVVYLEYAVPTEEHDESEASPPSPPSQQQHDDDDEKERDCAPETANGGGHDGHKLLNAHETTDDERAAAVNNNGGDKCGATHADLAAEDAATARDSDGIEQRLERECAARRARRRAQHMRELKQFLDAHVAPELPKVFRLVGQHLVTPAVVRTYDGARDGGGGGIAVSSPWRWRRPQQQQQQRRCSGVAVAASMRHA